MPVAATWLELEIIIVSQVKSEREKQTPYDITYMWNLKYNTNELIYETDRVQTCSCQGGAEGIQWEFGLADRNCYIQDG